MVVLRALSQVVFVAIGAFLLAKKPAVMKNGLSIFLFGLVMGVIHGVLEAVVVTAFWFSGMTMEGTFVSTVLGLVGVGTVVHSMVDYYLALLIWQPVSRAAKSARELHIFKRAEADSSEGFGLKRRGALGAPPLLCVRMLLCYNEPKEPCNNPRGSFV